MVDLRVNFAGLEFKNPIIVASAEPTNSVAHIKSCVDAGAGGVIVKTLTDSQAMMTLTQHSRYAILNERGELCQGRIPRSYTFYSRSGFIPEPWHEWRPKLAEAQAYAQERGAQVIGSVGALEPEAWPEIAAMAEGAGLKMLELNFGCPHPSQMGETKTGMLIGQDEALAAEITASVTRAVSIPVIVKLTPQVADMGAMARAVHQAGAAGVTVSNRFVAFAVDIETGRPYIDGRAGVGGPWVKPITLRWVSEIHSALGLPIAGSNGIYDWRDAVEFIMSGATVMEVCSVIMLKGFQAITTMLERLAAFMERKGYRTIEDMRGLATRAILSYGELLSLPKRRAVIDYGLCRDCKLCYRSCWYEAMDLQNGKVVTRPGNCIGCELCLSVCPVPEAIRLVPGQHRG
ncbi:MAG: tRNA-dihydrouridine synthase [Chloroflexi bacterium]|nr:tRNA-dihydrouridine synthase [Chloroflexota bacterium]